jgi:hypothetical protein
MHRQSLRVVLAGLIRAPRAMLLARWNWKSALCSSLVRASLFAGINAPAGPAQALAAASTELVYRALTSGFHGALTQALSRAEPVWMATLVAVVLLPVCAHALELVVHWALGTRYLMASILASVLLSIASTLFNLYAMRRGALIVGDDHAVSLLEDVKRLPRLLGGFVTEPLRLWTR